MKIKIFGDTLNSRTGIIEKWSSELGDWARVLLDVTQRDKKLQVWGEKNPGDESCIHLFQYLSSKYFHKVKDCGHEGMTGIFSMVVFLYNAMVLSGEKRAHYWDME